MGNDSTKAELIGIGIELISRNVKHSGQAKFTPFATTPLINLCGYEGTNKNTEALHINQLQVPENLQEQVKFKVEKLKDENELIVISKDTSYEEFNQK
jgi:hypothetical protein